MGMLRGPRTKLLFLVVLLLTPMMFIGNMEVGVIESVDSSVLSQSAGWLAGWQYRKSHAIEGSVGAGTNYQVRITVHRTTGPDSGEHVYVGTDCRADFGDIRFTDDDGITLLDYWMQESSSDTTSFWVEIADTLDVNAEIFIYYGNDVAGSTSDGSSTFPLFDDFDRVDSDNVGGGWFDDCGDGDNDIENNILKTVQNENEFCHIEKSAPLLLNFAVHGKLKQHAVAPASWKMAVGIYWGAGTWAKIGWRSNDNFEANLYVDGSFDSGALSYTNLDDSWCYYKIEVSSTSVDFYYSLNGVSWVLVHSTSRASATTNIPSLIIIGKGYENPSTGYSNPDWDNNYALAGSEYTNYADDIFVRKFIDVAPIHSSWSEEESENQATTPPPPPGPEGSDWVFIVIIGGGGLGVVAIVIIIIISKKQGGGGTPAGEYEW
ncbi:MAG: DUF2341 domain-containing protein [Candidatus Thorarchaeota archaeon]|nr:DUF2341 domain-containing protein [Candidatus Thorarchaeota archaeon]